MKALAIFAAVWFTVALIAPLGFMLWGFFAGDAVAVGVGGLIFGLGAVLTIPFVWSISGGDDVKR